MGVTIDRSREAAAFVAAIAEAPPDAVSACEGWTTHEIAAHVTGIHVEVIRHLEPFLQGDPVPETRSFEEREAPLQVTDHAELLELLDAEENRMRQLVDHIIGQQPEAVIPWTGRHMAVAKFIPHLRNEHALHRWDIAGDDDTSLQLLGQQDLVEHSVGELGRILLSAGRNHDPDPDTDFHVRLRSLRQPDPLVVVEGGNASLAWAQDNDAEEPALDLDPPARHLFIWGRRPDHRSRLHSHLDQPDLARLQTLLSGY
jgi:hypothetical protein